MPACLRPLRRRPFSRHFDNDRHRRLSACSCRRNTGRPVSARQSGNPKGRARGSRNKTTLALEALLDGQAEALTQKVIDKALEGDMGALRLCLDRILPPRRDRHVSVKLPAIASRRPKRIIRDRCRMRGRQIHSGGASELAGLVLGHVKAMEVSALESRIVALERSKQ